MASPKVGNTAVGAAACRLIEQYQPAAHRLFDDEVVGSLLSPPVRFLMRFAAMRNLALTQTESIAAGLYGSQICRARYIDDVVQAALAEGLGQVVSLGAGFDTRAYRLPGMEAASVFELDLPGVQNEKKHRLRQRLGHLPAHVTFIPIDFDTQTLEDAFAGTGFDRSRPAVVVWEAVTQYLPEEAVRGTLAFVGGSAPGSVLAFTYVLRSIIEHRSNLPGAEKLMKFAAQGAPFVFGFEPDTLAEYLKPFNLALAADVGNTDYQAKYLQPLGRALVVTEGERVAVARVVSA
jgi:methyltransferase (TIGR00027 family)